MLFRSTYTDGTTTTTIDIPYVSENICDISVPKFLAHSNNCWCKTYQCYEYSEGLIQDLFNDGKNFSRFSMKSCWINGVKYGYENPATNQEINVLCLILTGTNHSLATHQALANSEGDWYMKSIPGYNLYVLKEKNIHRPAPRLILMCKDDYQEYLLHYKQISSNEGPLSKNIDIEDMQENLSSLKTILNTAQQPLDQLVINEGLKIVNADGPDVKTNEIEYYKAPNTITLFRYFGKIKPYFIKPENDVYFNVNWEKLKYNEVVSNNPLYKKYSATQYQPFYPSIGYFTLRNTPVDYKNLYGWNF